MIRHDARTGLFFDQERHLYFQEAPDSYVPNVTRIIAGLGLIETQWFTKESRDRGRHVHLAIHYWLQGDLDWSTVHTPWEGHVRAAIRFLEDAKADPKKLQTEVLVYHPVFGYCGTADVFGEIFGEECVPDWKSGAIGEATGIQTALYDLAYPLPGGRRRRRIGVQLREDGTYKKRDLDRELDPQGLDYRRGMAAVDLYRRFLWKREKRELLNAA